MNFRLFCAQDGYQIAKWMTDPVYFNFFRGNSMIPTLEECASYPAWSGNIVMMLEGADESGGSHVCGMAIGYHANWRAGTVKAGVLIDKSCQKSKLGRDAMMKWAQFLFTRGFRKVAVEFVDEWLVEPLKKIGFFEESRHYQECKDQFGEEIDEIRMSCFSDGRQPSKERIEGKEVDTPPWVAEKAAAGNQSTTPDTPAH